jgi:hypothetical protein
MALIIEFYIPTRFHKKVKYIPLELRGQVIVLPLRARKTA